MTVLHRIERFAHDHGRHVGYLVVGILMAYLWIPIFVVTFMSFAQRAVLTFPPSHLTLDWYVKMFQDGSVVNAIITSLKVSAVVTPLSVIIATLIAYAFDRYDFRGKGLLELFVALPLIIPLVVLGIALTMFFGIIHVGSGFWPVVLGQTIEALPFATLIILPTLFSFDRKLEEASMDLGANELETFFQVTLPNIYTGIFAGGLMAFTISFNEFVVTFFVKSTTTNTLPTWMWSALRQQATPKVNAASVLFLTVAVVLILVTISLTNIERLATGNE